MSHLTGKSAVVTGASRGIGAAASKALAAAGASVVLAARTAREIETIAGEITKAGGTATTIVCDVTDYSAVASAVTAAREMTGSIDIMVNNAGVIDPIGHLVDSDPAAWVQATTINFAGTYHGVRAALPIMIDQSSGIVINISSGAAHSPLEAWSHYCSAKAGAAMLTQCAHLEAGEKGVRVMGLSPGTVATYMQEAISASGLNPVSQLDWSAHIPADWVGEAIVWMTTDDAAEFAGREVSLRDPDIRARVGLG